MKLGTSPLKWNPFFATGIFLLLVGFHIHLPQNGCHAIKTHMFTPTVDLEELTTSTVPLLANYLDELVLLRERRFESIKGLLEDYDQLGHDIRMAGAEVYLSNPVNQYLLIKRLTHDWIQIKDHIDSFNNGTNPIVRNQVVLPSKDDLGASALALLRLQSVYELDTRVIASGELLPNSNYQVKRQMTASDCWVIGQQAYLVGEDNQSLSWMEESIRRYHNEIHKTIPIQEIMQYQTFASYKLGNSEEALLLTRKLIESRLSTAVELKALYKKVEKARSIRIGETAQQRHDQVYKSLCRGENLMDPVAESKLRCYVSSMSNPFLVIQPVQMEQISIRPPISLFHHVLSDQEIEILQNLARPILQSVETIYHNSSGFSQIRVNNFAMITVKMEHDRPILKRILSQRAKDITGLEPSARLGNRIHNYGIGGHFSAHVDYVKDASHLEEGNPIGTWMYYLNDVEAGGRTAFLNAKTSIKPAKGSAAFWYNLYPSGEGNPDTLHAGCPVLTGEKWALVKLFYTHGQEFRRPCRLDPKEEI